ncbi:MAG: peptide ABC transporter substrate-binding protein [Oscillospiraceae bacterium]|nr:peptide ABC transporter substrate-binding protein [Oscillospiraceae bacterium]
MKTIKIKEICLFRKFLVTLIGILLIFVLSCCGGKKKCQSISCSFNEEPTSLDPQVVEDYPSSVLVINLFEGLVRLDKDSKVMPGIAESWESDSESRIFTFHLKKDAKWSDGKTSVTAKDFLFGIKRSIDPKTFSNSSKLLRIIKNASDISLNKMNLDNIGVFVLDDYTLKIELENSFKDFPVLCCNPCAMPCNEDFFKNTNGQYGKNSKTLLTNGPFKIGNRGWDHDKNINLVKNENYIYKNERAFTPIINFLVNKDNEEELKLFKNEDVDICHLKENEDIEVFKKNIDSNFVSFQNVLWGIVFNCSSNAFKDENMRKGFLSAIERDNIISKLPEGKFTKSDDIILNNAMFAGRNYRELVSGNFFYKGNSNPKSFIQNFLNESKIKIDNISIFSSDDDNVKIISNNILEVLNKNLGCHLNIKFFPLDELKKRVESKNFEFALVPFSLSSDPIKFLGSFLSDQQKNPAGLSDSEYDKIFENNFSGDTLKCIEKAEKYLNNKAVVYPVCSSLSYIAINKKISNLVFRQDQIVDFSFAKKEK